VSGVIQQLAIHSVAGVVTIANQGIGFFECGADARS
jgi:hypothetical protein